MYSPIEVSQAFDTVASREQVWRALEAAPCWPEVLLDLEQARIEPDGVLAAGAIVRSRAKPGTAAADMSYRVVVAETPRRLVIESESGYFQARTEYAIEAHGAGARVIVTSRLTPVLLLHKITTTLRRHRYADDLRNALVSRTDALLMLAERM